MSSFIKSLLLVLLGALLASLASYFWTANQIRQVSEPTTSLSIIDHTGRLDFDLLPACEYCAKREYNNTRDALLLARSAYEKYVAGDHEGAAETQLKFLQTGVSGYQDVSNLSLFMRLAGRHEESLKFSMDAKGFDEYEGVIRMRSQYHLAWSQLILKDYSGALKSIQLGLLAQPEYAFAYLRRAQAYMGLNQRRLAREDALRFVELLGEDRVNTISKSIRTDAFELFKELAILDALPKGISEDPRQGKM